MVHISILFFRELHYEKMVSRKRNIGFHPTNSFEVIGFFDGASHEGGGLCGVEGHIRVGSLVQFDLKMGCGSGTNN